MIEPAESAPPADLAAAPWALFLDIDGTLLDIAPTPGEVVVSEGLRELTGALHRAGEGALALVTGRPVADADRLFAPLRLPVAGQHGAERRDAEGNLHRAGPVPPQLDAIRQELAALAARHEGLLLEDKGFSIALHFRRAPELAEWVLARAAELVATAGDALCLQPGKMVAEIRPAGWDKGSAIAAFLAEPAFAGRRPVFVGDDLTDEHGFAVVNQAGGISVKVGPGPSAARWRLPHVAGVHSWLQAWLAAHREALNRSL